MSDQPQKPKTSVLAIVALVCSIACMPLLGFLLGLIALVRIGSSKGKLGGTVLAAIAVGLAVPVCGIQSAIAIPNFVKFQCRSKQSEARANLKALFFAEESTKAELGNYDADFDKLHFAPLGARVRYQYVVDDVKAGHFHAVARAKPDVAPELKGDTWEIDEHNELKNTLNGCDR